MTERFHHISAGFRTLMVHNLAKKYIEFIKRIIIFIFKFPVDPPKEFLMPFFKYAEKHEILQDKIFL